MVTALFFVLFDLIMLSVFDVLLERVVCTSYYYQILNGMPISISSVNIPGITTCLVGKFWDRTNLAALLVKVAFLIVVFTVDINTRTNYTTFCLTSTFDLDPSDANFPQNKFKVVERVKSKSASCRSITPNGVTFYHEAFNLTDGKVLDNELVSPPVQLEAIDRSTLTCLSPDYVGEGLPLLNVSGCSPFRTSDCSDPVPVTINTSIDLFGTIEDYFSVDWYDAILGNYFFPYYKPSLTSSQSVWANYSLRSLTCTVIDAGIPMDRSNIRWCIVASEIDNNTLVELWEFEKVNTSTFAAIRQFPGPLISGDFNIETNLSLITMIVSLSKKEYDWISFAAVLLTESLVYSNLVRSCSDSDALSSKLDSKIVTEVPWVPLGIAIGAFVLVIISFFVVRALTKRDQRPKINTIDGLSSILREEFNPTGQSYDTGRTSVIGLFDSPSETRSIRENEEAVYVAAVRKRHRFT